MVHMYVLYAYNDEGCVDSASMEFVVNFRKALYVPNAMYVGHADFEVSHFIPKESGMETYHIEILIHSEMLFGKVMHWMMKVDQLVLGTEHLEELP